MPNRRIDTIEWLKKMNIENYTLTEDCVVNVEGNVDLDNKGLDEIPVKFGVVTGDFGCAFNHLKTLHGAPHRVEGNFYCSNNRALNLLGAPEIVLGEFRCAECNLESLAGSPKKVGKDFRCNDNQLKSLRGAPTEVGGTFFASHNALKNLEGSPEQIGQAYCVSFNELRSLKGAPRKVGGNFVVSFNQLPDFESVKSVPAEIQGKCIMHSNPFKISLYELMQLSQLFVCSENFVCEVQPDIDSFLDKKGTLDISYFELKKYVLRVDLSEELIENNRSIKKLKL